jgi:hypothetical protein
VSIDPRSGEVVADPGSSVVLTVARVSSTPVQWIGGLYAATGQYLWASESYGEARGQTLAADAARAKAAERGYVVEREEGVQR